MSANKIAETSTSTGTGSITLAGAWSVPSSFITGNRTFNSFYGLNHFFPYMIQDQLGNWEKGVGYLSAVNTLVRETVVDNSLGTTALISFPAGEKLVMVPTDAGAMWPQSMVSGNVIRGANVRSVIAGTLALVADRVYLTPIIINRPMLVSAISFEVTTGAASTSVRAGLYSSVGVNTSSANMRLVAGSEGSAASDTTGAKDVSASCEIGQGLYFIAFVSDGTPTLRTYAAALQDIGAFTAINTTYHSSWNQNIAGSSASLPSQITGSLGGNGSGVSLLNGLKGAIQ
jgi:hypothetical protein